MTTSVHVDDGPHVGVISGIIRTRDGAPAVGATICLNEGTRSYDGETTLPPKVAEALLELRKATGEPRRPFFVSVGTSGYQPEIRRLRVLVKPKGRRLLRLTAHTDEQGRYQFRELPLSPYYLRAYTDTGIGQTSLTLEEDMSIREHDLSLWPSVAAVGRVVTSEGAPIPDAEVRASLRRDESSAAHASLGFPTPSDTRTDAGGRFTLTHLPAKWPFEHQSPAGRWRIVASAQGYLLGHVAFAGGTEEPLEIILPQASSARIRVLDEKTGKTLEGVPVGFAGPSRNASGVTGPDGVFTGNGLLPGECTARSATRKWLLAGEPPTILVLPPPAIAQVTLRVIPSGSISGRVVDAETGEGIGGAHISARPGRRLGAFSDAQGHYRIEGLAVGTYSVTRGATAGYRPAGKGSARSVVVEPGQDASVADFTADKGLRLAGRVFDEDGKPVHSTYVYARHGGRAQGVTTDADGRFELWGFTPGESAGVWARDLIRSHNGHRGLVSRRLWVQGVPAEGMDNITLVLGEQGSIAGRVIRGDGSPASMASISVKWKDGKVSETYTYTQKDGSFSVPKLVPGIYLVALSAKHSKTVEEVNVEPGQTVSEVTLTSQRKW